MDDCGEFPRFWFGSSRSQISGRTINTAFEEFSDVASTLQNTAIISCIGALTRFEPDDKDWRKDDGQNNPIPIPGGTLHQILVERRDTDNRNAAGHGFGDGLGQQLTFFPTRVVLSVSRCRIDLAYRALAVGNHSSYSPPCHKRSTLALP